MSESSASYYTSGQTSPIRRSLQQRQAEEARREADRLAAEAPASNLSPVTSADVYYKAAPAPVPPVNVSIPEGDPTAEKTEGDLVVDLPDELDPVEKAIGNAVVEDEDAEDAEEPEEEAGDEEDDSDDLDA